MTPSTNPLLQLQEFGQAIWLDYIRRSMIESGELQRLIDEDGLKGMTSNPHIFEKVITGSSDYDDAVRTLALDGKSADAIYDAVTVEDVRMAADKFRPLIDASGGVHGYVSLEVNPHLARDARATIEQGRRLWRALDRPNVFIKVPATREGLEAIRRLTTDGVNVNITLLFGLERYRDAAEAFIAGIEDRIARGEPVDRIRSVASFFLSRIDAEIDPKLDAIARGEANRAAAARALRGETAIACARIAYSMYKETFKGARFLASAEKGAKPQWLLWASTGTKDPSYPDVKYVEELIGPETINTVPQETLTAYRDHGNPSPRLEQDLDRARATLANLADIGISIDAVTDKLETDGIAKFNQPYDKLLDALETTREKAVEKAIGAQAIDAGPLDAAVRAR